MKLTIDNVVIWFFGYLGAALLTDRVSIQFIQTEWGNALTYLWILLCAGAVYTVSAVIDMAVSRLNKKLDQLDQLKQQNGKD